MGVDGPRNWEGITKEHDGCPSSLPTPSRPSGQQTGEPTRQLGLETEPHFAGTLRLAAEGPRVRRWFTAPLGLAVHVLAIASLVLTALYSTEMPLTPELAPLALSFAPPPPPPRMLGNTTEPVATEVSSPRPTRKAPDLTAIAKVPEAFLAAPSLDLDLVQGFPDGFVDGELGGMPEGVAGGVVGGVPGGVVGGVVGGSGRALPRFPKPDVGPSPLRMPQPSYTEDAIRNNVTGAVVLRVVIDEQGSVSVLEVLRSIPELDEEAIRVVESRWRFRPATRNGRPVPTLSDLVVRFQLH